MHVRLHGSLADYEFRAWTEFEHALGDARRLDFHDEAEAAALLRRLLATDPANSLCSLGSLIDDIARVELAHESVVEHVARLMVRGQIVVTRVPVVPYASDPLPERRYEPLEPEPLELDNHIGMTADILVEPPNVLVAKIELEPPPFASGWCEVEPPPFASGWCEVEPPVTVTPTIAVATG
jgi:hypothetical protein